MKFKLKDLCEVKNGYAFKSDNYTNSGIRVIRITNVQKGFVEDEHPEFYPLSYSDELNDYMLQENDLLLSLTGNVGRVALLNKEFLPAALNQRVAYLRTNNEKILNKYLFYYLLSKNFENDCIKYSKGIAQKNMSTEWLKEYELDIVSINEQNSIICIFDKLYRVINKYKIQLNHLDSLIKARFVEMFGDLNNTKYEIKTIEECAIFVKDGTHNTPMYTEDKINGFKFLSSKDVTSGKIDWSNIKYIPKELHNELYKRIKPQKNDILLAKNGTTGVCAIVDNDEIFDIYVSLALIRLKKDFNPTYIWTIINSYMVKEQFNKSLKGIGVPNLHLSEIKKVNLIVPPIDLQNSFATLVKHINKLKFDVQKSLKKTQVLLDSLMQEYFS